jgi:hypothetical protein
MWDRIRERFGSAGLIVGVIALVLAVAGGAYAAGGGLSSKQKKEVEKISKKFAGKPGANGSNGANGKDGANGSNGANGKDGAPGAPGKSITARAALPTECEERGGAIVEDGAAPPSKIEVCAGKEGTEGSPWTAGGTLPAPPAGPGGEGATETGSWVFTASEGDGAEAFAALTFPIQLSGVLGEDKVHWEGEANFEDFDGAGPETVGCSGSVAAPEAPSGNLCVFGAGNVSNATFVRIERLGHNVLPGGNRAGALLNFEPGATGDAFGSGSFAVTGF